MTGITRRPPGPLLRYGVASLCLAAATLLAFVVQPLSGPSAFLFFFAAVSVSSWYGRLGPALFAIGVSVVVLAFFFLPPVWSMSVGLTDAMGLALFALLAILINTLHWRQRGLERVIVNTQHEFTTARRIQQNLFPISPPRIMGFDVAGACRPANATGGDYFDFIPMTNGCVGIALGDVSGHGFGPALLMAETHAFLRALALVEHDVGTILTIANRLVCEDTLGEQFITLFLGCLDPRSRTFTYASAGHEGYLLGSDGVVTKLPSTGMALGVDPSVSIANAAPLVLEADQSILLFTDGVFEAASPDGELFGVKRAVELARRRRHDAAQTIIDALLDGVRDFLHDAPPEDDVTAIVVKAAAPASGAPDRSLSMVGAH